MDKNNAECSRRLEQTISTCCNESIANTATDKSTNQENTTLINPSVHITSIESLQSLNANRSLYSCRPKNIIISSENSLPVIVPRLSESITSRSLILLQHQNVVSNLPSPTSLVSNQPASLLLQAFAKLNQTSLHAGVTNYFLNMQQSSNNRNQRNFVLSKEISPPDSIANAPPSYSFVLRQMAARRRPRILGTFIPSASFIPHTPPPHYMAAFDIYVDPILPLPRVQHYGFTPMPVVCPNCGYTGMSVVISKITICTHLCALCLCVLCCWACAPLPYILRSCKDVYHYCRNCRQFLGMYCPTSPENSLS